LRPVSRIGVGYEPAGGVQRTMQKKPTSVRYLVLAVLCSLAFLTYLDRICIMRVQGEIERDLQLGQLSEADESSLQEHGLANDVEARAKLSRDRATERMSWIFSAFVFGYVLFEVPGGWLGDIFGARVMILRIVIWWSIFTALTGFIRPLAGIFSAAPGPGLLVGTLVAVRFLFGLGEAGAYPNIARALGRWFPFRERGTAQGAIWLSSRFGGAIAPALIGGLIAWAGGWQQAFWILGMAGVLWAVLFYVWFRNRPEEKSTVNAEECKLIRSDSIEAGSIYDDQTHSGVPWKRLVFSTNLLSLYLVAFTASFSWYFYVTFLPKYLKEEFHVDYSNSELMSGLPLFAGGIACLFGGRISDYIIARTGNRRWGRSLPGIIGMGMAGLCALAVTQVESVWMVVAIICVASAFQDLGLPSMWSVPVDVGGRYAGTVGGCMNSVGAIGGMLSPLIAAKVAIATGWKTVFFLFAASYLIGAIAWLRVDARQNILRND
jgi:MFS transporter, ACS family, glucarate transporter